MLVGPANNDKLHLASWNEAWTIEAWVKHAGPYGPDQHGGHFNWRGFGNFFGQIRISNIRRY